jgi:hypothetical protein
MTKGRELVENRLTGPTGIAMPRARILFLSRVFRPDLLISGLLSLGVWASGVLVPGGFVLLLAAGVSAQAQTANTRLILKDGTYQIVSQYQIVGDRVRYLSAERGQWEELPSSLVDWPATQKWAKDHAPGSKESSPAAASPGIPEAAAIDKEEQAERAEQMALTPQVMPGLLLPDRQGIWVLDNWQNRPELVELTQDSGDVNHRTGHNVLRGLLNPSGGMKRPIEMEGAVAKVQLHIDEPVFYVSLSTENGEETDDSGSALTVDTHGAGSAPDKDSFSSSTSQYVIVPVENNFKRNYRVLEPVKFGPGGVTSRAGNIIATKSQILTGKHWMKLTPSTTLSIGDYALVEILGPGEVNLSVWGFRVDPMGPENQNAILPLDRKP